MVWIISLSLHANGRRATSLVRMTVVMTKVGVLAGVANCCVRLASWGSMAVVVGVGLTCSGLLGVFACGWLILLLAIGIVIRARSPVRVRSGVAL